MTAPTEILGCKLTDAQRQKLSQLLDTELDLEKMWSLADELEDGLLLSYNVAKHARLAFEQSILRDRASKDPTLPVVP